MINNFTSHDFLQTDLCIIGAGPVGLFAAFEAGMHGIKSIVVDSLDFVGGQCSALYPQKPIYDIPGFCSILAEDLVTNLQNQAQRFNPNYLLGTKVVDIKQNKDGLAIVGESHANKTKITINAKAIIIAAGCGFFGPNKPPLQDIEYYENKSVFYLIKDKNIFKDKNVIIAGGGDSAVDWAVELSSIAKKVYVVHRRDKFRAMSESVQAMQKLVDDGVIQSLIPYSLKQINGDKASGLVQDIVIEDLDGLQKIVDAQYLLAFFGLTTDFGPLKNCGLEFDGLQIKVDQSTMQTNIDSVFAVGDACSYKNKLKLILTGFAEAATAVYKIKEIVFPGKVFNFEYSTSAFSKK